MRFTIPKNSFVLIVQGILNKGVNMVLSMAKDIPLWKYFHLQQDQLQVTELKESKYIKLINIVHCLKLPFLLAK